MKKLSKYLIFVFIAFFSLQVVATENQVNNPIVCLLTSEGVIEIKLYPNIAPKACENFLGLINQNYYNNITFHRVIKGFMIQTGDPTATGAGGTSIWNAPFKDEVHQNVQFDRPGLVAMANAGPNTNGSQFFITTVATPWLNMHHTIFGEVVSGFDIVQKIENSPTDYKNKPFKTKKIIEVRIK